MNANELTSSLCDLADKVLHATAIAETKISRLEAEIDVSENLVRHLHSENKQLRAENQQQQAEIESMKERMIVAEKELNHMRSFFGCDPAYYGMARAEPVAWMDYLEHSDVYDLNVSGRGIPLYTHPAKTLTDEEITQIVSEKLETWNSKESMIEFARALLRKASEK